MIYLITVMKMKNKLLGGKSYGKAKTKSIIDD